MDMDGGGTTMTTTATSPSSGGSVPPKEPNIPSNAPPTGLMPPPQPLLHTMSSPQIRPATSSPGSIGAATSAATAAPVPTSTANNHHVNSTARSPATGETPKQSLRGLNKPKCSECGNVARSRCPFQACKSCCVKAKNPCHIHVLKQSVSYLDKSPSSPLFDQQRTSASPSTISPTASSSRPYPTHSLHHNHSYLLGPHSQMRVKRPLTRKEIAAINTWRFSKLKECSDCKIEAEDEAFGRYMQNVSLLEDVFSLNAGPLEGLSADGHVAFESRLSEHPDSGTEDESDAMLVEGLKVRLKSNAKRSEKHKQRLRKIIDKGLQKLKRGENEDKNVSEDDDNNSAGYLSGPREVKRLRTIGRERLKKILLVNGLLDKLSKAQSQEDMNICIEMNMQIFGKNKSWHQVVNMKNTEEIDRIQNQEVMSDAIASEQKPVTIEMAGKGSNLESSCGLFGGQERQFSSNPERYVKGWTKVDISEDIIQNATEDLSIMKDIAEL